MARPSRRRETGSRSESPRLVGGLALVVVTVLVAFVVGAFLLDVVSLDRIVSMAHELIDGDTIAPSPPSRTDG